MYVLWLTLDVADVENLDLIQTVNQAIRICVDCGSTLILIDEKRIKCSDCGNIRFFSD